MRKIVIAATLVAAAAVVPIVGGAVWFAGSARMRPPSPAAALYFPTAEPQQVVYHVMGGGGWFGREHLHRMSIISNHLEAVGEGFLDLRVVLQGDGLDLLIAARSDSKLAARIDRFKAAGVRFMICRNSLVARRLDPERDLYGVDRADIVAAGVAEVARLQKLGFAYLKI